MTATIRHGSLDLPTGGLLATMVRLNLAVTDVLEAIAGRSGLAFADYLVLGVVRRSPDGRSSPSAIADVLARTTGGMSLTLDRLESAGLVRRTPDATDGRRVIVELTDRGARLAREVNDELHAWERSIDLPMPSSDAVALLDDVVEAVRSHPA